MGKQKKKYYVVWEGHRPGVYDTWSACQAQVTGYPGARYKSFTSRSEAEDAYTGNPHDFISRKSKPQVKKVADKSGIILPSFSVDAACSGNPGKMEYRGVWTEDGTELFRIGPYDGGTNNIGEFLALVHALAFFQKAGKPNMPIYTDSKIAMGWIKKKKCNTKMSRNSRNAIIFELIGRAESWLKSNTYKNPILKWETKKWGEIPADFGRK